MPITVKKTTKIAFAAVALLALIIFPNFNVGSIATLFAQSLEDQLRDIEDELDDIRDSRTLVRRERDASQQQANRYSGEIGKLQAEVEDLQLDISELELKIDELELNVKLLERQIQDTEIIITGRVEEISDLEDATLNRLRTGYKEFRMSQPDENILTTGNINEYFKAEQYRSLLQQRTNVVLSGLVEQKAQLEYDREQLAEKKLQLARDREVLEDQRSDLKKKEKDVEEKMNRYYGALYAVQNSVNQLNNQINNLSREEQQKQAEAEKVRQAIFNSFNPIQQGTYVVAGTMIGRQGRTGLATGNHVHFMTHFNGRSYNPCTFVPPGRFGNCGGNSTLRWPLSGSFFFTSGYGNRCLGITGCRFHDAIDIAHGSANAPVYAAHDGYLTKGVDSFGALYIIICERPNCNTRFKTGYWHLSSY